MSTVLKRLKDQQKNKTEVMSEDMATELYTQVSEKFTRKMEDDNRAQMAAALADLNAKVKILESERDLAIKEQGNLKDIINELDRNNSSLKQQLTQAKADLIIKSEDYDEDKKEANHRENGLKGKIHDLEKEMAMLKGQLSVPMPEPVAIPEFDFEVERDMNGRITNVSAKPRLN